MYSGCPKLTEVCLNFNITVPAHPKCRIRRAWFNALLGTTGTGMDLINTADVENLASRLHNISKDIAQALTINAKWIPTTLNQHELSLTYDAEVFAVV